MRRQNFDGYIASEPRVASAINFAHTARAQRHLDLIRPEFCASGEAHGWLGLYREIRHLNRPARRMGMWLSLNLSLL